MGLVVRVQEKVVDVHAVRLDGAQVGFNCGKKQTRFDYDTFVVKSIVETIADRRKVSGRLKTSKNLFR